MALLLLSAVAAAVDALSYLGLGHVFPANMTGNTVLLGVGLATGDPGAAGRSALALGAYVVAAAGAGALLPDRGWSRRLATALTVELGLLVAGAGCWIAAGPRPAGVTRLVLVVLAGLAMGTQSAAVARLGVPGVSTTYITGTWTALSSGFGRRTAGLPDRPPGRDLARQFGVVAVYAAGALVAGLAFRAGHATATLIPVGLLVVAAVTGGTLARRSGVTSG